LKLGAKIDATNKLGNTPLHLAARHGHLSVMQALLDRGASLEFKDEFGQTALHSAVTEGHLNIVKYLFDKGNSDHIIKSNPYELSYFELRRKIRIASSQSAVIFDNFY